MLSKSTMNGFQHSRIHTEMEPMLRLPKCVYHHGGRWGGTSHPELI